MPVMITLKKIRDTSHSVDGWEEALYAHEHLGMDTEFPLSSVLDSNHLNDVLRCFNALPEYIEITKRFAIWCARDVQNLMTNEPSVNALDVAERCLDGNATLEEVIAANAIDAARAARAATYTAAAAEAARAAARSATYTDVTYAAAAASRAARAAADAAAAAVDAARAATYTAAARAAAVRAVDDIYTDAAAAAARAVDDAYAADCAARTATYAATREKQIAKLREMLDAV